jgi:hypothetical protein
LFCARFFGFGWLGISALFAANYGLNEVTRLRVLI